MEAAMTDPRQESDNDTVEHREEALAELRRQIRTEAALLAELRADAAHLEEAARARRKPFIGLAYVVGLVLGGPLWLLGVLISEKVGR
jgi:hypothetical protein